MREEEEEVEEVGVMGVPHLFRCPISLDLLTDPVTLSTGQTYDRSSIEKWLKAGNLTCPVTMQKLQDPSIVPNHTLKHLINQWLTKPSNQDHHHQHLRVIDPDLSLASLKHTLESQQPIFTTILDTLDKISILSEIEWKRSCLIQLGFFPLLLNFLFCSNAEVSQDKTEVFEKALDCVLTLLPFCDMGSLNMLKETSNFESFKALLQNGSTKMKTSLCSLVEAISSTMETKELCLLIGQSERVLRGVIALLNLKSEASEAGIKAISALCSFESNRENAIREGLVDGIVTFLLSVSSTSREVCKAMSTLELVLQLESAKQALISNHNGVKILVKMVFKVSDDHGGSESAVTSLLMICSGNAKGREEAISAGIVKQLLLLLQSQCSVRAKNKARALLKLLRSMWAEGLTKRDL
ncbi:hypothetical protein Scep_002434 [Stephania cephalantha]|uniref:U-box domain-containing protein n=1 Tax=Stephania cephalantha TaxID=152367 RepID=A0AAP0Q4Z2_9MAGN